MKILFNHEGYENLVVVPDGSYSVTVESENDDKQLVLRANCERFILESTKEISQSVRGANDYLAASMFVDMYNELVYYISQLPEGLDIDITSIQSRVRNSYEEAWKQIETCLVNWNTEKCEEKQNQTTHMKAPYIFTKILASLKEEQGGSIEEWFRNAEVKLNEAGNLVITVQSAFCREVIKRCCSSLMKECLIEMGLDSMDIIFVDNEGNEDV